jgi:Nascent polypeptide associated complex NAC
MFGGGGGGLDPSKMQQMMKQMGIDVDELDAEEVVIKTADEDLVFSAPEVQRMDAQGQATYTIVGSPEHRAAGASTSESPAGSADDSVRIPDDDVELVAGRTGVSQRTARDALEATDGDLAAAVDRLE